MNASNSAVRPKTKIYVGSLYRKRNEESTIRQVRVTGVSDYYNRMNDRAQKLVLFTVDKGGEWGKFWHLPLEEFRSQFEQVESPKDSNDKGTNIDGASLDDANQ